ncbi:PREDICTED: uncharacterized protein LOC108566408 isoform X2 [Nicrophorus vespilloides]|nr:PREDICTED: uncharacterized protein LOC108566408 isoform X2 [Nicrophorus vespilloides]
MSSAVITLEPGRENRCNLTVKAPASHLVHVQFHEVDLELHRTIINKPIHPSCNLDIYLPDNREIPVWSGDLCSVDPLRKVDLLNSDIKMTWNSAINPLFTKGRKVILTAIGQNDVCNRNDQHICMRIGWMPTKCISKHLACNGHMNCPQGSTTSDEDETLCHTQMKFKEFVDFFKKQINPNGIVQPSPNISTEIKNIIMPKWKEIMRVETSTRQSPKLPYMEDEEENLLSIGNIPWLVSIIGIIAICLLAILFYIVKKSKHSHDHEDPTTQNDTTGMGFSHGHRLSDSEPPNYDDLDQPPSYHSLFPTKTDDTPHEEIPMERINNQSES